ncbi:hypothetical protein [Streptomyces microflavus]|uniref:hypothetical protein n=1 Tax=Streptomyces microflavus TaxID=1919 RepID=UPI0033ED9767
MEGEFGWNGGIGVALALALVRPWGMRIPGALVAFCAWVGSGLLVSILPFGVLSTPLSCAPAPTHRTAATSR